MKTKIDPAHKSNPSFSSNPVETPPHPPVDSLPQLQSELARVLRRITEAQNAYNHVPSKPRKSPIVHTAPRVKRVTRKGLDGKQEWRDHRKTHATCSPSDGWHVLVEHPNVVVIATTHRDADDYYEPEISVTYTVVDRSKTYKGTTSLKYALEVFMFACVNELLYRLRRLPESIGSQRLARLARFVQKEKRSAKWQEGRTGQDDELDNVPDSYSLSPWEEWNQ